MTSKNIVDFVAAVATGQSAAAVDFIRNEIQSRVQSRVTEYGQSYQYKVGETQNEPTATE